MKKSFRYIREILDRIYPEPRISGMAQKKIVNKLYRATVFNSTIRQSDWLLKQSFSPGRSAAGYPLLYI